MLPCEQEAVSSVPGLPAIAKSGPAPPLSRTPDTTRMWSPNQGVPALQLPCVSSVGVCGEWPLGSPCVGTAMTSSEHYILSMSP